MTRSAKQGNQERLSIHTNRETRCSYMGINHDSNQLHHPLLVSPTKLILTKTHPPQTCLIDLTAHPNA